MIELLYASVVMSAGLILYHHLLYPLILRLANRADTPSLPPSPQEWPAITVLVPACDEEAVIGAKIDNLAALDYSRKKLWVTVVCDGCRDGTAEKARESAARHPDLVVTVIECAENRGKVAVLNETIPAIGTDILVLTDASARVETDALKRVACWMRDKTVGVVSGVYVLSEDASAGEQVYWRYQVAIKRGEARIDSPIGVHGAFYAVRPELFAPLEPDTINDDVILPMRIRLAGFCIVYDVRMKILEKEKADSHVDFRRRQRIAAGNIQQVIRLAAALDPRRGGLFFVFASGKGLRAVMPLLLLWCLIGNALLIPVHSFWTWTMIVQAILYAVAVFPAGIPVAVTIRYFVIGHLAGLIGLGQYAARRYRRPWHRAGVP
ncbi:MAG: glycosyltransferase family 2 protein [Pseudomonadota bacterium]|nr:glycosyltransferase family 2 protein [Pseudomonadota bacterium]